MTKALTLFPPTRTEALTRLAQFLPHAGRDYASKRNFDLGEGRHVHVSTLSPYLRHRLLTEQDVIEATLKRHSAEASEKFIQEVFWRTYWKGWLELRPTVWRDYQRSLVRSLDDIQTQSGLRARWEDACKGETGIACFDHWAQELVRTGYLHNHARMWFASIWVFTLNLPWQTGADFFLRHLLDGDPASNTLSWRWVAGIQTPGKTYLARPDNIAKYTNGRFRPDGLAREAPALQAPAKPDVRPPGDLPAPAKGKRTGLILHNDDLSPQAVLQAAGPVHATFCLTTTDRQSPLKPAEHVAEFTSHAMQDVTRRWAEQLGTTTQGSTAQEIDAWADAQGLEQIVTAYAPVGPNADTLAAVQACDVVRIRRAYDSAAWPGATHGFFKFKETIPDLITRMGQNATTG